MVYLCHFLSNFAGEKRKVCYGIISMAKRLIHDD